MEKINNYIATKKDMPKCDTREECRKQLANLIELMTFLEEKLQTFENIKDKSGKSIKLQEVESVCIEDIRKSKIYKQGDTFNNFLQKLEKQDGLKACSSIFKNNKEVYKMLETMSPEELKIIFGSTNSNLNKYIKRGLAATAVSLVLNQILAKKQLEKLKKNNKKIK